MILDYEKIGRIKKALKYRPKGMSITDIARQLRLNRNSVAKYLEILLISGHVEAKQFGTSKVYTLSERVPVTAMMDFSSDMIALLDEEHRIVRANDRFLKYAGLPHETVVGKHIGETGIPLLRNISPETRNFSENGSESPDILELADGEDRIFSIKMIPSIFDDGTSGTTVIIEDITERKLAEQKIAEREQQYRSVIEHIQDVFFQVDSGGNLVLASPSWTTLLGYSSLTDCIGKNIPGEFVQDISRWESLMEILKKDQTVRDYELELRHKTGTPVSVSVTCHLCPDKNGDLPGVEGLFRDISEKKKAYRVKKFLAAIVESTDDAIIGKELDGTIISWNPAAERLYGYSADEMIGRPISHIIPTDQRLHMESVMRRIGAGESVTGIESSRTRKDGTHIDVSLTISPVHESDGKVIGASTIARDITQRKAEERLRESEERFRPMVDNIAVGIYRSTGDPRGKFIWGNSSLVRILGYPSLETLKGIGVADIFVEPDGRQKLLEELRRSGFVKNREIQLKRVDGTIVTVSVTALARFNTLGEVVCINGLVEDITGQRVAEDDARTLNKEIRDITGFLPVPVFIIDKEGVVTAWNTAMEHLTGVPASDMLGRKEYAIAFGSSGEKRKALVDYLDSPNKSPLEPVTRTNQREYDVLIADIKAPNLDNGTGGWLRVQVCALKDPSGHPIGAIECIQRLPEQGEDPGGEEVSSGQDAAGLAESGVRGHTPTEGTFVPATEGNVPSMISLLYLSNALKHAGDGIGILDNSARCVWTNDALSDFFGVAGSEAILGKSIAQFTAADQRKQVLDRISAARVSGCARFPFPTQIPGKTYGLNARVSVIADERGNPLGFLMILREAS